MDDAAFRRSMNGPGRYFARHPTVYRLSLAGAAGTALYATLGAVRTPSVRRLPWTALAILEAAITIGIINARRTARTGAAGPADDRPAVTTGPAPSPEPKVSADLSGCDQA
jgi:hypothetical protein